MKLKKIISYGLSLFFVVQSVLGQAYHKTEQGLKANVSGIDVEIRFYAPDIVRVTKSLPGVAVTPNPFTVVMQPGSISFRLEEKEGKVSLRSDSLQVSLDLATGKIAYADKGNKQLLGEKDYGAQLTPVKYANFETFLVRQAFRLDSDEPIYGLGQHQTGKMIQRNQMVYLRQNNTEICIPYWQSVKGYGVYWDNTSPTTFTDNVNETAFDSQAGECVDYYFLYGGKPDEVVRRMRDLTGHAPMNPLWTYGYWQSRSRYEKQDELLSAVRKYRELQVPLDCIVQDWQYWGTDNKYWNSTAFDSERFPDPRQMVEEVHRQNAHIAISVWPSFGKETEIGKTFKEKNMLLRFQTWPMSADVYDPFHPEARDIYWSYLEKNIFSLGIDNWWLDATEPEFWDHERNMSIPCHLGLYRKYFNAFPIASISGVHDHQRAICSDKRVSILTRCAFAGQQRYGTVCWSGDIQSSWESLKTQIPAGLNYSVCGLPYWNTDIGGFLTVDTYPEGVADPAFRELYVRWLQYGCFNTQMRSHSASAPREIYLFGDRGNWAFDAIEKYIKLRYKLLPYIYATSWRVSKYGDTFMRPLFMDYVQDKQVYGLSDEYMFGSSILVAPVTDPMYTIKGKEADFSQTKSMEVYLPKGNDWYDFWTGEKVSGGRNVNRESPIDIMPLYVKAGSILPMGPDVQYATEKKWDNLEMRVYPGSDGEFLLYEDENDNYNYEQGAYSTISFRWNDKERTLTIGGREGEFSGMLNTRKFRVVLVDKGQGTGDKLSKKVTKVVTYKGKEIKIRL